MIRQTTYGLARRMGRNAGAQFLATGLRPPCPFKGARLAPLALAWFRGFAEVTGPALRPKGKPTDGDQ